MSDIKTVLTDEQKAQFVAAICNYGTDFVVPLFAVVESIEQAVLAAAPASSAIAIQPSDTPRPDRKEHPRLDVPIDPQCSAKLDELGDDRGQGLDEYWKYGFRTGWHHAKAAPQVAQPSAEATTWRCFHCNEEFNDMESAALHFGKSERQEPICFVDQKKYRELQELAERYCAEDTDLHREIYRLHGQINEQVRRAEEQGYARALKDTNYTEGTPPTVDQSQDVVAMQPVDAKDAERLDWLLNNLRDFHAILFDGATPLMYRGQYLKSPDWLRNEIDAARAIAASKSQSSPSDKPCGEQDNEVKP